MHLNYFVALVAFGAFLLVLTVGFIVTQAIDLAALMMGAKLQAQNVAILTYASITVAWSLLVAGLWVRYRGLSPPLVILQRISKLTLLGHVSILAGHVLALCAFFIKDFGFLLLLPLIAIFVLYFVGVLSLEVSRARRRARNGA
jgi:hypothetical protein